MLPKPEFASQHRGGLARQPGAAARATAAPSFTAGTYRIPHASPDSSNSSGPEKYEQGTPLTNCVPFEAKLLSNATAVIG
jgi:hypothetical protein